MVRKGSGGGGLDTSLLFSNLILLGTLGLSVVAWIIAFVAQIAAEAEGQREGVLWFNIFLQLFLILGIALVIMTDSIAGSRLQISAFLAVALVFAVIGIDDGIYSSNGGRNAATAGWFILTIIDVIWLLFFTSEEDSYVYGLLSGFGNSALGGPGGRSGRGTGGIRGATSQVNGSGYGGSYPSNQGIGPGAYQPTYGQGPSAADITIDPQKSNGLVGGPGSTRSLHTNNQAGGMSATGRTGSALGKSDYSHHGSDVGRAASPSSVNKQSAPATIEGAMGEPSEGYGYRARALYAYQANADDPTEISFSKGEILDIVDNSGKWWQARKPNGETGIVPSNYMQVL